MPPRVRGFPFPTLCIQIPFTCLRWKVVFVDHVQLDQMDHMFVHQSASTNKLFECLPVGETSQYLRSVHHPVPALPHSEAESYPFTNCSKETYIPDAKFVGSPETHLLIFRLVSLTTLVMLTQNVNVLTSFACRAPCSHVFWQFYE